METYKPPLEGAKALELCLWGCGDDCGCHKFEIRSVQDHKHPDTPHYYNYTDDWSRLLWDGTWFWPYCWTDETDYDELRQELEAAAKAYGMTLKLDGPYHAWEGRKDLP